MAITMQERVDSRAVRDGDREEITFRYYLDGTADEQAAKDHVAANTATTYEGLRRRDMRVEPVWVDTNAGAGHWDVEVVYVEDHSTLVAFDTTGGTQHLTYSLQTIAAYPNPGAPDCKNAIGVTKEGVEGVDVVMPVYAWTETFYKDDADVTQEYRGKLFNLTGKTNNATFHGCNAGECLCFGFQGSRMEDGQWEITAHFRGSPNRTNLQVGDITGIDKKGWEYLWVMYAKEVDETASMTVFRPVAVYIERVCDSADFTDIGID